jgi:hypothetical protein
MSMNANTHDIHDTRHPIAPAEVRRRLVDARVSVPQASRVKAAAAIQGAQAARAAWRSASPSPVALLPFPPVGNTRGA